MQSIIFEIDTQRGVATGFPEAAICVQKLDDSLRSAIRITYRISLRSSSLREPRYPLLTVVRCFVFVLAPERTKTWTLVNVVKGV